MENADPNLRFLGWIYFTPSTLTVKEFPPERMVFHYYMLIEGQIRAHSPQGDAFSTQVLYDDTNTTFEKDFPP